MTLAPLALAISLLAPTPAPDFGQAWTQVENAIRGRFYARDRRKEEMEGLLKEFAPMARAAKSEGEFSRAVNTMIARFQDSHFHLVTREDQGFYLNDGLLNRQNPQALPHIGAWFKPAQEGYVVEMVLQGFAAEKAGLRKGDLVTAIDANPFSPVSALRPLVGKTARLEWRRGSQNLAAEIGVRESPALQLFLEASRNSSRIIEQGGKKVGYFHLWTQANDDFRNALAAAVYGNLQNTDAFILDLRDGFGGRPEGFADPFFRPESRIEWRTGPNQGLNQLFGYQRPLVVLINGGSRSAKEVLSHILKRSGRATLVGQTTAGAVLGTSPQRIGDWAYLQVPMVEVITDGQRLEDVGVAPDVRVAPEIGPNGEDRVLARGLEIAIEKVGSRA